MAALDEYLQRDPGQAWAIRRKAYAWQKLDEPEHALSFYRQAAELGDAYAQNAYGWHLMEGIGTPKNTREAIKWFRAAAQQGNADAHVNLKTALLRDQ